MRKKSKIMIRDRDLDISESIALGMASAGGRGGEVMHDQRWFNQEKGMDSGFATDDAYNIYDKDLCTAKSTMSCLCRPKKDADDEMNGGADGQLEKLRNMECFKPDRVSAGTLERNGRPRDGLAEFEKKQEQPEEDPFGLDIMIEVETGKKPIDKIGSGGTLEG